MLAPPTVQPVSWNLAFLVTLSWIRPSHLLTSVVFEGTGQLYGASEVEATGIVGVVTLVELAEGPHVAGSPPSVAAGV